jgi:hypothetical protein
MSDGSGMEWVIGGEHERALLLRCKALQSWKAKGEVDHDPPEPTRSEIENFEAELTELRVYSGFVGRSGAQSSFALNDLEPSNGSNRAGVFPGLLGASSSITERVQAQEARVTPIEQSTSLGGGMP